MKTRLTVLALACSIGLVGCGTYNHNTAKHAKANQQDINIASAISTIDSDDSANIVVAEQKAAQKPTVSTRVLFGFDKSELSTDFKSELDQVVTYLNDNPQAKVNVEGYADARGKAAYNLALGMRRAQAVSQYLQERGAKPSQVEVRSFGSERLAMSGDSSDVHAANRRVEVVFDSDESWG